MLAPLRGASLVYYFIIQIQLTYFITDILIRLVQVQVEPSFPFFHYASIPILCFHILFFHFFAWLHFPLCHFRKRKRMGGIWTAYVPVAVRALYPLDHCDHPCMENFCCYLIFLVWCRQCRLTTITFCELTARDTAKLDETNLFWAWKSKSLNKS